MTTPDRDTTPDRGTVEAVDGEAQRPPRPTTRGPACAGGCVGGRRVWAGSPPSERPGEPDSMALAIDTPAVAVSPGEPAAAYIAITAEGRDVVPTSSLRRVFTFEGVRGMQAW